MQKSPTLLIFLLAGLISAITVQADAPLDDELALAMQLDGNLDRGRELYTICAACHTTEGWGTNDGVFPQLSGQHRSVVIKQLADIRAGNRDNPEMLPFAKRSAFGDAQAISDVALYIDTLKMNPRPGYGKGGDMEKVERIYFNKCAQCHGTNGQGDAEKYYPRIHGQHYEYLLRQLKWIQEGKRRNANKIMMRKIKRMKQEDLELIADYVSRLEPPAEMMAEADWKNPDFWDK